MPPCMHSALRDQNLRLLSHVSSVSIKHAKDNACHGAFPAAASPGMLAQTSWHTANHVTTVSHAPDGMTNLKGSAVGISPDCCGSSKSLLCAAEQEAHIARLRNLEASGDASLQNGLDAAVSTLRSIPPYGHREVPSTSFLHSCVLLHHPAGTYLAMPLVYDRTSPRPCFPCPHHVHTSMVYRLPCVTRGARHCRCRC